MSARGIYSQCEHCCGTGKVLKAGVTEAQRLRRVINRTVSWITRWERNKRPGNREKIALAEKRLAALQFQLRAQTGAVH